MTSEQKKNPEKLFNIILVGCGRVARKHLKALIYHQTAGERLGLPRLRLQAVVDPNREAAAQLLADYRRKLIFDGPHPPIYPNLTEALAAQGRTDIVAITTPSGSHYDLARQALLAGCHLFVEKPITMHSDQAKDLLEVASQRQLKIVVGHIYRFFPLVQDLEQDLRAGKFGRILYGDVKVRWGHDQAYYDQAAWRGTRDLDGGAIMNQSIHALDLMRWLLGNPDILSSKAYLARQIHQIESEDLGLALFELAGNTWLSLEGTTNTDPSRPEASFFICCTAGEIRAGIRAGRVRAKVFQGQTDKTFSYLVKYLYRTWRLAGCRGLLELANPHTGLYTDLLSAIYYDRQPLASGQTGLAALEWVETIYRSAGLEID